MVLISKNENKEKHQSVNFTNIKRLKSGKILKVATQKILKSGNGK